MSEQKEAEDKESGAEDEIKPPVYDPDVITEEDIEKIWSTMQKNSATKKKIKRKLELGLASTDTTPTTDYSEMYLPIQSENLREVLEIDRDRAKMEETLRMKKVKPKTYLTQVILYDNISHERLLNQKLRQLKHRHAVVEKKIKRKRESFVQQLESKQNEWTRLDARVLHKFDPKNMPELSFKFGTLYHSANYPYQAAINSLRGLQPQKPKNVKKPHILPQITRRIVTRNESTSSEAESDSNKVFITRMPKRKNRAEENSVDGQTVHEDAKVSPPNKPNIRVRPNGPLIRPANAEKTLPPVCGRRNQRLPPKQRNWLEDSRYVTLTSLLGPRYSAKKNLTRQDLPITHLV